MSTGEVVTIGDYERLKAERDLYRDALLSIRRKVDHWEAERTFAVSPIHYSHWMELGSIARDALANWPESATESTNSVNE